MTNLLEFESIKKFIDILGKDIKEYFGKDDAVILCLRPEGMFYGEALVQWLKQKKKTNVNLVSMEDDGADLDGRAVRGRKVLIVNNDIVTGKTRIRCKRKVCAGNPRGHAPLSRDPSTSRSPRITSGSPCAFHFC